MYSVEIAGVDTEAVPEIAFSPGTLSHTLDLSSLDVIGRAEELAYLSFSQYCELSQSRIMDARQKYARWVVRRVLFWAERMRAPVNKKVTDWWVKHEKKPGVMVRLDERRIYKDWRVMRELPLVLRNYGCPEEHLKSVERLIHLKLAIKWGINL